MSISTENQAALDQALTNLTAQMGVPADTPLDLTKLTEVSLSGAGVFDKLLATCSLAAEAEFNEERIRGTDYASFYLGMVQGVLQNATQFLVAWDKAAVEKANMLAQLQVNLKQIDLIAAQIADVESTTAVRDTQSANDTKVKDQQVLESIANTNLREQQILESESNVSIAETQSNNDTLTKTQQVKLIKAQTTLYTQKVITELAETNTTVPTVTSDTDMDTIVPLVPIKVAGAKGANRDVTLEQRAGYMRKAQNDLIKVATGHVDMLVSSGAATDVGDYTSELLELLQTGASTGNFGPDSLLAIAVTDVAQLTPNTADSQD